MYSALTVLMWKHCIVRMRKFIQTPLEFAAPILLFVLLFALKNQIMSILPLNELNDHNFGGIQSSEVYPLESTVGPSAVVYMPETEHTARLMDAVGTELHLQRLGAFPGGRARGYYGFAPNSSEESLAQNIIESEAFVIFQSMNGTFPDRLNYTIRMKGKFLTNTYYSQDDSIIPHERFGAIYERFMRLQWAIDKSYLNLRTGNYITQVVELQEFPFVETATNPFAEAVSEVVVVICYLGMFLPFVFLTARLMGERITGVQELIKTAGVSSLTLALSHLLNMVPTGLVYSIIGTALLKASPMPFIPNSNWFLMFIAFVLHYLTIVAFAFVCSFLTKRTQYVMTVSVLVYVIMWLPMMLVGDVLMPRGVLLLTGFLPHAPMYWFFREVASLEKYGSGVSWSTMTQAHGERSGSVLESYLFMLVQLAILSALTCYLTLVCPGPYGTPLPWNFFCKKKVSPEKLVDDQEQPMVRDSQFFEEPPQNKDIGIKICKVTKVFGKDRAVDNVTFDVYNGEITVLLGHNGAGKTTLMSIITGMMNATSGRVYVNGLDSVSRQRDVRRQLGLCTQHNLFIGDLTVLEHVMFFAMLKGSTYSNSRKSGLELLQELRFAEKADCKSAELSGGMKRRLQLACALAGGSDVLVLDEPTSGLDVETRRELWDLLLSLRGRRTVLLTTHFMEEADALGDRVAALHRGVLRCHATPMHLKKHIGTGYRLSLTTIGLPREEAISRTVTSHVPDATLRENSLNSVAYSLPATQVAHFPKLFEALETGRSELGVDNIGVGMPTLEEVFLKLCSNVDTSFAQDEIDSTVPEPTFNKLSGWRLYARQFVTLIMRNVYFLMSTKISFLMLQVVIPITYIVIFTYILTAHLDLSGDVMPAEVSMDLNMYQDMQSRVLYNLDNKEALERVQKRFSNVEFKPTTDVVSAMVEVGQRDTDEYSKYLVGIELNATYTKVLFTTIYRHTAPVGLNLLSNLLAAQSVPWADGGVIATYNHPLDPAPEVATRDITLVEPTDPTSIITWVMFIVTMTLSSVSNAVTLPCKEMAAGTRHIHIMSGCPPALHWLSRLAFHFVLYMVLLAAPTVIAIAVFDNKDTLSAGNALGMLTLVLVLGILAWLAVVYLLSFHFAERPAGGVAVILVLMGAITACVQGITVLFNFTVNAFWTAILSITQYCLTPHTVAGALLKTGGVARLNAYCALNRDTCPDILDLIPGMDRHKCCVLRQDPGNYFSFDRSSPAPEIVILCAQIVIFMILVILTENGVFSGLWDLLMNKAYRPTAARYDDQMVRAERTYVNKAITMPSKQIPDAMLLDDLHKNYFRLIRKSCNSVKGVSLSVKKGECFGVLGVNGAGKSTTFKMIVAETSSTRGGVFANQRHLRIPRAEYLRSLGYCPQFFGLDEFQTGAQNLTLLLTLRGLSAADVAAEVDAWIDVVGLQQYKDQPVSEYSGGCKRRMATAAALSSGAPLTLLDEPTSGVDVSARRRVWAALRRGLQQHRAVIITSHSMDEMEALCGRIAIMSGGEVCALGSPSALRAAHAAGHAVVLKVASRAGHGDETDSSGPVMGLKADMHANFDCKLKDEHKTMLHFHINETLQYSELFSKLEQLKASYPELVEDYTVTETTLEEVFLSFAHDAQAHAGVLDP